MSSETTNQLRSRIANSRIAKLPSNWESWSQEQQARLLQQLDSIDLAELEKLVGGHDQKTDFAELAGRAQAPPAARADGSGAAWSVNEARQLGEQALTDGHVAVLIVAGGQGTRLGFDQPKGMFPIGPVSNRTLFQIFADQLRATERRYGKAIPLFLMTSPATHEETVTYMQATNYLGLDRELVKVFQQGTMPAVDAQTGQLLVEAPGSFALSPDGHGGTVKALAKSGSLQQMKDAGIRHLFYAQVDNPLVQLCDPLLIGHHLMAGSDMTTQVVRKRYATERVGNVVLVDGRVMIIEYSDLPESAAAMTDESGQLKLWAGNIAVHVLETEFLESMSKNPDSLPFHRAHKKVPYLDATGNLIEPESPNAIKFERFIFDLLPAAENAFVVEGLAAEVFAPVKNADGAPNDTPAAARAQISDLHASWLRQAGVNIAPNVTVEINPLIALDAHEVQTAVAAGKLLATGTTLDHDQYFA